jgi:hypothetical protein
MEQLEIECRTTVMAAVKDGDVQTAVKMLERLDPKLAPPSQSKGIEHRGEIAARVRDMTDEELLARGRELFDRIPGARLLTNGAEERGTGE